MLSRCLPKDSYHAQAVALSNELEAFKTRMVTTRAVILEIGNALSKQRYRQAAAGYCHLSLSTGSGKSCQGIFGFCDQELERVHDIEVLYKFVLSRLPPEMHPDERTT